MHEKLILSSGLCKNICCPVTDQEDRLIPDRILLVSEDAALDFDTDMNRAE